MAMDGENNSTTFIDLKGHAVTPVGNAKISTAQNKFGGASAVFDGSGDSLSIPSSADFGFGTGDFTVECWIRLATSPSGTTNVLDFRTSNSAEVWVWNISSSRYLGGYSPSGTIPVASTSALAINTWHHIALTRASGTMRQFVNGVVVASGTYTGDLGSSRPLRIGSNPSNGDVLNGFIDDLRITKGVARYTADFTPPEEPLFEYCS